jgi:HEAT repeat protein
VQASVSTTVNPQALLGGAPGARTTTLVRYRARLELTADADSGVDGRLRGVLRDLTGAEAIGDELQRDLARPFLVTMDRSCRLGSFAFDDADPRRSRDMKKQLLLALEFVAPADDEAASWEAMQADGTGEYAARYRRAGERGELRREKLRYTKVRGPTPEARLTVELARVQAVATPREDGPWLARAEVSERTRMLTPSKSIFAETAGAVSLVYAPARSAAPIALVDAAKGLAWEDARDFDHAAAVRSPYDDLAPLPGPSTTLGDELARLAAADFRGGRLDGAAVKRLVAYLRFNPDAVPELIERIKSDAVAPDLHSVLFFALEKTATPAAQRGLVTALKDEELREMNRIRAVHALADVASPLPEAVDAMIDVAGRYTESQAHGDSLPASALLALGVLHQRQSDGSLAQRVGDLLAERLADAPAAEQRAVILEAIGNTGDAAREAAVAAFLGDAEPSVRVAAARALARLGGPGRDTLLAAALGREIDPRVRQATAEAWVKSESRGGTVVTELAGLLERETDDGVKMSLIALLGREVSHDETAKAALVQALQRAQSPQGKREIGRYLSAKDLPGGRL